MVLSGSQTNAGVITGPDSTGGCSVGSSESGGGGPALDCSSWAASGTGDDAALGASSAAAIDCAREGEGEYHPHGEYHVATCCAGGPLVCITPSRVSPACIGDASLASFAPSSSFAGVAPVAGISSPCVGSSGSGVSSAASGAAVAARTSSVAETAFSGGDDVVDAAVQPT